MGPGLTRIFFGGKSTQNSNKPVLIFWSSITCVFCLYYTLIKVVGYYDLSVLSMSVMGFQKVWMGGGWGELDQFFFWIFRIFFNFAKPLMLTCIVNSFSNIT